MKSEQNAFAPAESGFDGITEADTDFFVDDEAVNDGFDGVLFFGIKFDARAVVKFEKIAVNASADEAFPREALDHVAELPFFVANNRGKNHYASSWRQREDS